MADTVHAAEALTRSPFKSRYDNFIGGEFRAPNAGRYFENVSPLTGKAIGEIARSDASDVNAALDAAPRHPLLPPRERMTDA